MELLFVCGAISFSTGVLIAWHMYKLGYIAGKAEMVRRMRMRNNEL